MDDKCQALLELCSSLGAEHFSSDLSGQYITKVISMYFCLLNANFEGGMPKSDQPILEDEPILSKHFSKEELLWIAILAGHDKSAELLVRSGAVDVKNGSNVNAADDKGYRLTSKQVTTTCVSRYTWLPRLEESASLLYTNEDKDARPEFRRIAVNRRETSLIKARQRIIERYPRLQKYYLNCFEEITRFIETCTLYELTVPNRCAYAKSQLRRTYFKLSAYTGTGEAD
ncbi:hypothetical protein TSAR_008835 [Trichomalopsis sarcophagae]|uniref:Uncharacterized protein n=1 Tax=Trichomalopsis sarcophagae TaxID=543379 RepID=A0A232F3P8_9HYME|nr:hypothetical protein TSAR_008835 [Trichomalopsis sarcophagae]